MSLINTIESEETGSENEVIGPRFLIIKFQIQDLLGFWVER